MRLTIIERFRIPELFPKSADYITFLLRDSINSKVKFTEEEIDEWELKVEDNKFSWNPEKVQEKEIEFSKSETELLKKLLEELNSSDKLTEEYIRLYVEIVKPEVSL